MAQTEEKIRDELKRIVGKNDDGQRFPVMSGVVMSVDSSDMTCEVQLTCRFVEGQQSTTPGVMLNVIASNVAGMYLLPVVGANCEVAELDGPGSWSIIRADSYTKIALTLGSAPTTLTVTDGLIQFNDGSLDGLVKVIDLTTKLNNLENDINNLKTALNTIIGTPLATASPGSPDVCYVAMKAALTTYAGSTLTVTEQSDIENTNVKQG